MGGGGYVVRFRNLKDRQKNFIRGYTYDFGSGGTPNPRYIPLYGEALLKELANLSGAAFSMTTMGEVLPRKENFVRINPNVKDEWGIPALHITRNIRITNMRWRRTQWRWQSRCAAGPGSRCWRNTRKWFRRARAFMSWVHVAWVRP